MTGLVNRDIIVLTNSVNCSLQMLCISEVITIQYVSFEKLEKEKKLSILNAGFKIFGEYGYTKASVEDIVKMANISKGSLFYYFESKKNFFVYLYEYCGQLLENLVDNPGPDGQPAYMKYTDFFDRLDAIQLLKMKFSKDYPDINIFMKKIIFDSTPVAKEEITKINNKYTKERAMLFLKGLDFHKFKDEIDPMMIISLLTWCSEGCVNQILLTQKMNPQLQGSTPDFDKVVTMYRSYVQLFRNNFYKEEYL